MRRPKTCITKADKLIIPKPPSCMSKAKKKRPQGVKSRSTSKMLSPVTQTELTAEKAASKKSTGSLVEKGR